MTGDTSLLRQVSPSWVQGGRVTSQVFRPTRKDNRRLSVYDGDLVTAEEAWEHYSDELGFTSVGVLAVTVDECEAHDLAAESDPTPFRAHAVIRFDGYPVAQIATKAKHLRIAAEERGWQYEAEAEE